MHLSSWEVGVFFIFNSMQEEDINKVSVTLLLKGSRLERMFELLERSKQPKTIADMREEIYRCIDKVYLMY